MAALSHIEALERANSQISNTVSAESLLVPVEHLPRWKVRDVVAHLGGVQEWAHRIVTTRSMDGPGSKKAKLDGDELTDWFDSGAQALVQQFRDLNLSEPCPNFNPGSERNVGWWVRRQAHEATVHRWDIEQALGGGSAIAADLAADGVDEFLDVFVRTRGKQTLDTTLVLKTTGSQQWTLTPAQKAGRIDVAPGPPDEPIGVITEIVGPAEALLLALWGRVTASESGLQINGDPAAAASMVAL